MERGYKLKDRPEYRSKPRPITFKKTDTVAKAVKIMSEKNYGSVVVVDNQNKVIGICTERDILKKQLKSIVLQMMLKTLIKMLYVNHCQK